MSHVPSAVRVAATALAVLVVADLVGVVVSFVLDVAPMRHKSVGLGYAVWFVLGVFAGFIHYGASAGDRATSGWSSSAEARSAGIVVLGTSSAVVALLAALFHLSMWRHGDGPEWAVAPDHAPTTAVFFLAFLAAAFVAHRASPPAATGPSS